MAVIVTNFQGTTIAFNLHKYWTHPFRAMALRAVKYGVGVVKTELDV